MSCRVINCIAVLGMGVVEWAAASGSNPLREMNQNQANRTKPTVLYCSALNGID